MPETPHFIRVGRFGPKWIEVFSSRCALVAHSLLDLCIRWVVYCTAVYTRGLIGCAEHEVVILSLLSRLEGQMIEIDVLLKPIRDDAPSGVDFRLDPEKDAIFGRVKDFRQVLDPAHDPDGRGKEPNWSAVVKACEEALGTETKDLELLAYLTEGLTHQHGFAGFHQGLELIRRSLETFWESIHPGVDEDGISEALRSRWVSWFSSAEFLRAIKSAPINRADAAEDRGTAGRTPDLSWADYEGALMVDDQTISDERRKELLEAGYMSLEEFQSRVGATAPDRLRAVQAPPRTS